jgi:molybdopterin-guanine dinucleotide biosynthesis adapter protein
MRVIGFAGWSNSGKTTLIEQLIPRLTAAGQRVSLVKHAHHGFDIDQPGKDSYRHREAGATEVLVTSGQRYALMHELRGAPELSLAAAVNLLSPCDVVLVEGFKTAAIAKIEVHRTGLGKPLLFPGDPCIVALVSDTPQLSGGRLQEFRLDAYDALATYVLQSAQAVTADV